MSEQLTPSGEQGVDLIGPCNVERSKNYRRVARCPFERGRFPGVPVPTASMAAGEHETEHYDRASLHLCMHDSNLRQGPVKTEGPQSISVVDQAASCSLFRRSRRTEVWRRRLHPKLRHGGDRRSREGARAREVIGRDPRAGGADGLAPPPHCTLAGRFCTELHTKPPGTR